MSPWSLTASWPAAVRLHSRSNKKRSAFWRRLRRRKSRHRQLVFPTKSRDVSRDGRQEWLDSAESGVIPEPFAGRDYSDSAERTMAGKRATPCRRYRAIPAGRSGSTSSSGGLEHLRNKVDAESRDPPVAFAT